LGVRELSANVAALNLKALLFVDEGATTATFARDVNRPSASSSIGISYMYIFI